MQARFILSCSLILNLLLAQAVQAKTTQVVVTAPHIVELMYAIGAGEQILGTTEHSDYPEQAKQIPRVGNYAGLQIEKILALNPDYIIARKTGNPTEDLERIETLGIPVVYSNPTRLESVADDLLMLGKLTGHQTQAQQVAQAYLAKLSQLRAAYADKSEISVFYQLWSAPLTTVANQAWPQKLLEVCHVNNPFASLKGDYPQISIEHVLVEQPRLIIIPTSSGEPNQIKGYWQKFASIPAVKHEQIKLVNSDKLHRMTPRVLDELEVMCQKIEDTRAYYTASL